MEDVVEMPSKCFH